MSFWIVEIHRQLNVYELNGTSKQSLCSLDDEGIRSLIFQENVVKLGTYDSVGQSWENVGEN